MPVWLPLLKASLPYVTQIVATAIPAFTTKPPAEKSGKVDKVDDVTAQQIAELQTAVTQNAESIHVLAEKLQQTIQGIEAAGIELQKKLEFFRRLMFAAIGVAIVSLVIAIASFAT
jgi:hypothetical protein